MSSKPLSIDQTLLRAKSHIKKGEVEQAQQLYQAILEKYPKNKSATEGLKALSKPTQKNLDTDLNQNQVNSLIDLYKQGRLQETLAQAAALAQQYPNAPLIPNLLGAVYTKLGRKEDAITSYNKALELRPDDVRAHYKLGNALSMLGKHEQAITCYHKAIALKPDHAGAYNDLGNCLNSLGKHEAAISNYRRALTIDPDNSVIHHNLGAALNMLERYEEAITSYRTGIKISPDNTLMHHNLGAALSSLNRHEEAAASYNRSFNLDNNHISAYIAMLNQLGYICDWNRIEEKIQGNLKALEFGTTPNEVASPFYFLSLIDDAEFQRKASEAYALANYKDKSAPAPLSSRPITDRIRIGYFSADFHDHATMHLMAELFERHDRSKFEIHAFSFGPDNKDNMRSRLLNSIETIHTVRLKGDAEIADLSRSLGIDIAVDLKGYTKNCRAGIFSYRAAPIQVNYLGYPGTMGAPYIDYIIADPVLIPPKSQKFYSEKIAYLPNSYQVNDSTRGISNETPSRADLGISEESFVFCCFNNNYKITPDVFDIWMRLLEKVDASILWLLNSNQLAEQNLRKEAMKRGINPDRLIFAKKIPLPDHLARHQLADLFLDTFYVNAHTTASDALWAGLPILTKMGESFASRVSGSLLNALALPELITTTAQEYENTALKLATHPHELKMINKKLKNNIKTTTLFDAKVFTKHIEAAYTHMFKRQKKGFEPDHFYIEN